MTGSGWFLMQMDDLLVVRSLTKVFEEKEFAASAVEGKLDEAGHVRPDTEAHSSNCLMEQNELCGWNGYSIPTC